MLEDHVARVNAALFGGAARLHLPDFGRREGLAVGHEQDRQDDDREDEIRRRPGGDDRGALAQPLVVERDLSLGLG